MQRLIAISAALLLAACSPSQAPTDTAEAPDESTSAPEFDIHVDRFGDVEVLRYQVPGFDELSLQEKKLAYYLSQSALAGRDILYDQNYRHNLRIRKLLTAIVRSYVGDRSSEAYGHLLEYAKHVWYANGIHHHYSMDKMLPEFMSDELAAMASESDASQMPLAYQVPGFDELSLQEKKLAYYLSQSALAGRDILYDQNYRHNLRIRKLLTAIVRSYVGDRSSEAYGHLLEYAKHVWYANGIHHHYSMDKMLPEFTPDELAAMASESDASQMPLDDGQTVDELLAMLEAPIFDPDTAPKRVTLDPEVDQVVNSANNYYRDVTADETAAFYAAKENAEPDRPVSWGLNSQLTKSDGEVVERTWKIGGMYGPALEQVVYWLEKAATVAENDLQKDWIEKLVTYYKSGDLKDYDAYNIAWVADTDSRLDAVNGFTEVYGDAIGYRGSWESVVSLRDLEATHRISTIGANAQWFEDNSTLMDEHKKKSVVGISAKVITVIQEGGDMAHSSTIGINLPNANWIRRDHGSKSVTLGNKMEAYEIAAASSGLSESVSAT